MNTAKNRRCGISQPRSSTHVRKLSLTRYNGLSLIMRVNFAKGAKSIKTMSKK
jgi:hypothetical protein